MCVFWLLISFSSPSSQISFEPWVWCIPEFGAESKSSLMQDFLLTSAVFGVRGRKEKPAQIPGTHQSPADTRSDSRHGVAI